MARLRQLRKIADDHAGKFRSDGLRTLFATLQRELDDEYFEEISYHLKQLRFRAGVLISAELDRDNSGIGFVLRAPGEARRRWTERLGIGPRTTYSFTLAPRDEAGGQILEDLTSRGINLVANAAAQSADHIGSYFTMLRAELGFYVSCLNLADRLAAKGVAVTVPEPTQPSIAHVFVHGPARCLPGAAVSAPGHRQRRAGRREVAGHHHRRQLGREIDVPAQRRRGPAHDAVRAVRHRASPTGRTWPAGSSPTSSGKRMPA